MREELIHKLPSGVASLFAPNSSPGEQMEGAYTPCWVLQGVTAVEERVRGNKIDYKLISTENKLKL
jgi:hypothetical protein